MTVIAWTVEHARGAHQAAREDLATRISARAKKAWKVAKLQPITLHECRHTFASLMIAVGVNAKAISEYMGHANISITMDRYGHLMPGNEAQAAALLDTYLSKTGANTGRSQDDLAN